MRRTLTAAALLGVFVVAPAGSAFASPNVNPVTGKPGNSYGNCGVAGKWASAVTASDAYNDLTPDGGYGGQASLRNDCFGGGTTDTSEGPVS